MSEIPRDRLLGLLRERIFAFAASRIARESAEDVAQETLMLLHEKYAHLERMEDLLPVALQIVRFKLIAQYRKAVRRGEHSQISVDDIPLPGEELDPERALERKELLERLTGAIAGMGDRCRDLFRLKIEGRGFEEIRRLMGAASINTIYTWDFRCRKQLMEKLGGSWHAPRKAKS